MEAEPLVLITTVQPILIVWIAAIVFFVSMAITAAISPGRRWFELAVIFQLAFLVNLMAGLVIVQWIVGVEIFQMEAIGRVSMDMRLLPPLD